MTITDNLLQLKSQLPEHVTLVAVSKTKPIQAIEEAYRAGQRIFGENKIQEMTDKWEQLPKDIQWHMIGHVQSNKVKYMAPYVALIHGVDSLKLLEEINKQAAKNNRVIACLLQVHIAEEATKFGFNAAELETLLQSEAFKRLNHIQVTGLMGMATFTDNTTQIRNEFVSLKKLFNHYQSINTSNCQLNILSMGMSGDYEIAIECGSTLVRIGSSIFGVRN
jgi:pyridoxal phosphate enzyme (YggS family)